ncbi:hypothetical protein BCR44DRAFT_1443904, partial [Catenaria anguillulae PL171]
MIAPNKADSAIMRNGHSVTQQTFDTVWRFWYETVLRTKARTWYDLSSFAFTVGIGAYDAAPTLTVVASFAAGRVAAAGSASAGGAGAVSPEAVMFLSGAESSDVFLASKMRVLPGRGVEDDAPEMGDKTWPGRTLFVEGARGAVCIDSHSPL